MTDATAPAPAPALVVLVVDTMPRCGACGRMLALALARPWHLRCPRCGADCYRAAVLPPDPPALTSSPG